MRKVLSLLLAMVVVVGISMPVSAYNVATVEPQEKLIAAGSRSGATIDEDGFLWMWGAARPGDAADDYSKTPARYMGNVKSVSCGSRFSGIIKNDGSLWMWGENDYGQIGNGKPNGEEWVANPVKILDNVLSVSCGASHTGAVLSDHSLWMWGKISAIGNSIQGNDKTEYGVGIQTTPIKVMDNVAAVSCGNSYTAIIKNDGSLWVWGYGVGFGLLETLEATKLMDDVVSVSCGSSHIAIVTSDSSLWMWGNNSAGQLGVDKDSFPKVNDRPVKVLDNVSQAVAGGEATAAILTDGTLWVWGDNTFRALTGQDATADAWNPEGGIQMTPIKIMDGVRSVSLGERFVQFVIVQKDDGSLWAWGENDYGQIGSSGGRQYTSFSWGSSVDHSVQTTPTQIDLIDFSTSPNVTINGVPVVWTNAKPFIDRNGYTMVPPAPMADAIGVNTSWDSTKTSNTVYFSGDAQEGKGLIFPIGSKTVKTYGGDTIEMGTTAVVVDKRAYVPVRYLAEYYGYTISWDNETRTVILQK